ncbi:MAG: hypothetical protein ACP5DZ_10785, partial [Bacteroidales bacterium]
IFAISCNSGENKNKEGEKTSEEENKAQIVDLQSFNEAYETLEFETCDEFETAMEYYTDIYFSTLDKAVEGDEDAIAEFKELHDMLKPLGEQAGKLKEQCPERIDELESKYKEKVDNNRDEIDQIINPDAAEVAEINDEVAENEKAVGSEPKQINPDAQKQTQKPIKAVEGKKLNIKEETSKPDAGI